MNIKKLKVNAVQHYFEILSTDTLLDTVAQLYDVDNKNSRLYRYNNKYYLELDRNSVPNNLKRNDNVYLKGKLEEYGTLICQNAITKIGSKLKEL